jgi:hypothetical protein
MLIEFELFLKAHRLYDKGALFDTEIKAVTTVAPEIDVLGLGQDVDGDEFDLDGKEVEQHCEGVVHCIMPEGI